MQCSVAPHISFVSCIRSDIFIVSCKGMYGIGTWMWTQKPAPAVIHTQLLVPLVSSQITFTDILGRRCSLWPKSIISHTFAGNFREFMGTHAGTSGLSGSKFPSSWLKNPRSLSLLPFCLSFVIGCLFLMLLLASIHAWDWLPACTKRVWYWEICYWFSTDGADHSGLHCAVLRRCNEPDVYTCACYWILTECAPWSNKLIELCV